MTEQDNGSTWPLPKFRFEVDFGDNMKGIAFQEVSGLDSEAKIVEYRHDSPSQTSPIKMPGIDKITNVTLRRGIFVNDNHFWAWQSKIQMNVIERRNVVIRLLDENGKTTMTWTLHNAWPTKITGNDLKSDGNEVAVDALELASEMVVVGS